MEFEISDNGGKSKAVNVTGALLPCMTALLLSLASIKARAPCSLRGLGGLLVGFLGAMHGGSEAEAARQASMQTPTTRPATDRFVPCMRGAALVGRSRRWLRGGCSSPEPR